MVKRVVIGWDEALFGWLLSANVASAALSDVEGSDDLVFRLLDDFVSLVELSLS